MNRLEHKKNTAALRAHRVRTKTKGSAERPRLTVTISNLHVTAQIINDQEHHTLAAATTVGQKSEALKGTMTDKARWVGEEIAKKAKAKKVTKVVLDRGDKKYHGRVQALADAARQGGLEF